jgi:hypothetical protein
MRMPAGSRSKQAWMRTFGGEIDEAAEQVDFGWRQTTGHPENDVVVSREWEEVLESVAVLDAVESGLRDEQVEQFALGLEGREVVAGHRRRPPGSIRRNREQNATYRSGPRIDGAERLLIHGKSVVTVIVGAAYRDAHANSPIQPTWP